MGTGPALWWVAFRIQGCGSLLCPPKVRAHWPERKGQQFHRSPLWAQCCLENLPSSYPQVFVPEARARTICVCISGGFLLDVTLHGASELRVPSGTRRQFLATLLGLEIGPLALVEPSSGFKYEKQKEPWANVWQDCRKSASVTMVREVGLGSPEVSSREGGWRMCERWRF